MAGNRWDWGQSGTCSLWVPINSVGVLEASTWRKLAGWLTREAEADERGAIWVGDHPPFYPFFTIAALLPYEIFYNQRYRQFSGI